METVEDEDNRPVNIAPHNSNRVLELANGSHDDDDLPNHIQLEVPATNVRLNIFWKKIIAYYLFSWKNHSRSSSVQVTDDDDPAPFDEDDENLTDIGDGAGEEAEEAESSDAELGMVSFYLL